MKFFFSCDWGTSAFRLRLIDATNLKVLLEVKTNQGIAATFEQWKKMQQDEADRPAFYQTYLFEQVAKIHADFKDALDNVPVILSGMASSSIGMIELPYKEIPFNVNGSDLISHVLPATNTFPHEVIIISGARSEEDVVRGEETMLVGCNISNEATERLFIFPGTHSKHLTVKNGTVINTKTYMTGELFDLLSNKSILSASVKKSDQPADWPNSFFTTGVKEGMVSVLTNSIFHVRTNHLLKKASAEENYDYLSGLLIGHELRGVEESKPAAITLVCSGELQNAYLQALNMVLPNVTKDCTDASEALIKGQWGILQQRVIK